MALNHLKTALPDSFKGQKHCDVTFVCNDPTSDTGKSTIMAHKFILSLASEVFETMFYGEATKHGNVKGKMDPIHIDDIQMPAFKLLLSFIYNILVEFETPEIAAEFYYAAHKYNVVDALTFVGSYILKEVSSKNVIVFYDVACLYENQELKDACVKIFGYNTTDVINSPAFLKADPKVIEAIYKLNDLNITSEVQLVTALEHYIQHNIADSSDIVEKVRPALGHIRFLTLAAPVIAQTTLLNAEDSLAVIACLSSDVALSKMPTFLSSNDQKRFVKGIVLKPTEEIVMIRKLSSVYNDKFCNHCVIGGTDSNHVYWECPSGATLYTRVELKMIYKKYNHVSLMEYKADDVAAIYGRYKSLGWVN